MGSRSTSSSTDLPRRSNDNRMPRHERLRRRQRLSNNKMGFRRKKMQILWVMDKWRSMPRSHSMKSNNRWTNNMMRSMICRHNKIGICRRDKRLRTGTSQLRMRADTTSNMLRVDMTSNSSNNNRERTRAWAMWSRITRLWECRIGREDMERGGLWEGTVSTFIARGDSAIKMNLDCVR